MADEAKKSPSELAEEEDEETTSENQEDDESSDEAEDKAPEADDASDEEAEDGEGDDDLDELEEDILKMEEEDLSDPANQAKVLEAYKKTKSLIKQKKHWREKAKGADKEADKPPVPKKKPASKGSELEEIRRLTERNDFRLDHPEIPSKMVDEVQDYASAKGISLEEALQKPIVRKFVNDKDARARLAKASPSSKHRGPQTAKPIDWTKATPEQVAAHRNEILSRPRT
jgi:hypothetical protein